MLMNYHELTMEESKDSPARSKQFKVICLVMVVAVTYSTLSTGALKPVKVEEGVFPGGEFHYKFTGRDYAAANSLVDATAKDLGVKDKQHENVMYTLFLDDPLKINGRRQRFAGGILFNEHTQGYLEATATAKGLETMPSIEERKATIAELNESIIDPTREDLNELAAVKLWERLKFSKQELPAVRCAVVKFTSTHGFVSALIHSYKVFPAIRKYAKQHGAPGVIPVVATTCSIKDSVCTHYVPLENAENFMLGRKEQNPAPGEGLVNWKGVKGMLLKIVTFGQKGGDKPDRDEL